jgi:hypothetical protein
VGRTKKIGENNNGLLFVQKGISGYVRDKTLIKSLKQGAWRNHS